MSQGNRRGLVGVALGLAVLGAGGMAQRGWAQRAAGGPYGRAAVYTGTSRRGSLQEALETAVGQAARAQRGADRLVRYRVREITGEQGGIAATNTVSVSIELTR